MDYLAANDDGAEDEVRVVATNTNDPEELDSRTATFSLRGAKRASPEVLIIIKNPNTMDIDEPSRPSKRQKTEGAIQDLNEMSFDEGLDQFGQGHAYREWEEERTIVQADRSEHVSVASDRPCRTPKSKQPKTTTANSKPKQTPEEVTSSTSGPATGTRSHRASNSSTQFGATGLISKYGVLSAPPQIPGRKVRITSLPSKVTLEEVKDFLTDFQHDPLCLTMGEGKKKKKKVASVLVQFRSLSEAQRAITELNGRMVRSRKVILFYDYDEATESQTATASQPLAPEEWLQTATAPRPLQKATPVPQPSQKPSAPQVSRAFEILSDDEEGEIDETALAQTLDLPGTAARTEEDQQTERIHGAARQMAARLSKGKFGHNPPQLKFYEGLALLLSVRWPTVAAARKTVSRDVLRRRLYSIIPFARYDKIRFCLQPKKAKDKDPEKCIVIYTSQEAATAAETYLKSKQFTEQDLSFTIEVQRSEDIKFTAARTAAAHQLVPKGFDRESLAIGIAAAARKEIAHGMYTIKNYLAYCSNPQNPLFEEKQEAKQAPSERKSTLLTALIVTYLEHFEFPNTDVFCLGRPLLTR